MPKRSESQRAARRREAEHLRLAMTEEKKPPLKVGQRRLSLRAYFSLYVPF